MKKVVCSNLYTLPFFYNDKGSDKMSTTSYGYINPFALSFISMKIRYNDYDNSIEDLNYVTPNDSVNVFINFESVLNNLSMIKDIDNKLLLERNHSYILESEAINLCAHYKKFFRGNNLPTNVFLYYTNLNSSEFINCKYNDEYRSYYFNKYLQNPKFLLLGNSLIDKIIPRLQKIMEFIPNVYFISVSNIESSLVPYIISKEYPNNKNFIISTDKYETQYQILDNFCMHYIRRSPFGTKIFNMFKKHIDDIFKDNPENELDTSLFKNPSFYSLLLSIMGDKMRSIEPIKGVGPKTLLKFLSSAIEKGEITNKTNSIEMLTKAFNEDQYSSIIDNFNCINIPQQYNELSQQNIFDIKNQIVDRFDFNSLIQLNREDYRDYPLMLPELTC